MTIGSVLTTYICCYDFMLFGHIFVMISCCSVNIPDKFPRYSQKISVQLEMASLDAMMKKSEELLRDYDLLSDQVT